MLRRLLILLTIGVLALPAVAMARFQTGDYELTLSGVGTSDNDLDNNDFAMQVSLGYFFTDHLEGILRQEAGFTARDEGNDDWRGSTSLGAVWNFGQDKWRPFLGASLGYIYGDDIEETFFGSPEVGLKVFVNNTTFVQALVQYQWFFDDMDEADNNFDDGSFVYGLGLGFKW